MDASISQTFLAAKLSSALPQFRFSLSQLMVMITAAAIVLGLVMTMDYILSFVVSLVWCVLPTPLVICVAFGRGTTRAGAIGALVPWVLLLRDGVLAPDLWDVLWLLTQSVVCGLVAVYTYGRLYRKQ